MPRSLKDYLLYLGTGLFLSVSVSAAEPGAGHYTLLSRSTANQMDVQLDKAQWQWIKNKRNLILGTSSPDYPPFDLTTSGRDYEGFTADYAGGEIAIDTSEIAQAAWFGPHDALPPMPPLSGRH